MTGRSSRFLLPLLLVAVAACGTSSAAIHGAGKRGSIKLTLNTVPTVRSVIVSPGKGTFSDCHFGDSAQNTHSTADKLGFPNGTCWFGAQSHKFPIVITNTGIASNIDIFAGNAIPSNGGTSWSLCNVGNRPMTACTGGDDHRKPGADQYLVRNFSAGQRSNFAGLSDVPQCDRQFAFHSCWAVEGQLQAEGVELVGPSSSSDTAVSWTVTITWMPVPR